MKHLSVNSTNLACLLLILTSAVARPLVTYETFRQALIQGEERRMEGGTLVLTTKEAIVDKILTTLKHKEIDEGFKNNSNYAGAMHFFKGKPLIESSPIFDIIKLMPKGAALHIHHSASVSSSWIIKNLTYRPEAEICTKANGVIIFTVGNYKYCSDEPKKIIDERQNKSNPDDYDAWLENQINLYDPNPEFAYPDGNTVWKEFQGMFDTLKYLLNYAPFFRDHTYRMLEEFYNDKIYYTEMRTGLSELIDEQGNKVDDSEASRIIQDVAKDFAKDHPNFIGLKLIFSPHRVNGPQSLDTKVATYLKLKQQSPSFIIGFDLVGQEDLGKPLVEFKQLIEGLPKDTNFFFHAGETNWWGTPTDLNLVDAILLNTTRIGHGYALLKHPLLWSSVFTRNIAIEVSPISNQVLHLVADLRNHPAALYLSQNMPVVICNDDPGFWDAQGLSYDYYMAFMSFAPATAGLKLLKQLVLNAIRFSNLTPDERARYDLVFAKSWDQFLNSVIDKYRED